MSNFSSEFHDISRSLIEYIARFKVEAQEYAQKEKASPFFIEKNNAKLEALYLIKKRFDNLFEAMFLVDEEQFEAGQIAGYKQAKKEFDKLSNPYDPYLTSEKEAYRYANIARAISTWPELYS